MAKKSPSVKVIKYAKAVASGMSKAKAKELAGYSPNTLTTTIDESNAYKSLSVKDALLSKITLEEIADIHTKIIRSDNEMASLNAIKLGYERIEPETNQAEDVEKVVVVLSKD